MPGGTAWITADGLDFLAEWHLATLTTSLPGGAPHVVPVGFTFDLATGLARVITCSASQKVANARGGGQAALCQVDRARWVSLTGPVRVETCRAEVDEGLLRYGVRYLRRPRPNPDRVVLLLRVERVRGSGDMVSPPPMPYPP